MQSSSKNGSGVKIKVVKKAINPQHFVPQPIILYAYYNNKINKFTWFIFYFGSNYGLTIWTV